MAGILGLSKKAGEGPPRAIQMPGWQSLSLRGRIRERKLVLTNPKGLVQAAVGLHVERFAGAVLQLQNL